MQSCSMIKKVFAPGAGFLWSWGPFLWPPPVQADSLEVPGPGSCEVGFEAEAPLQKYTLAPGRLTCSSLKGTQTPRPAPVLDGLAPTLENTISHNYKNIAEYAVVSKEQRLNDVARDFVELHFSLDGHAVMQQYGVMPVERE